MATQKQKFELIQRLRDLGFTYEEAQTLRRAQLTLHRWAELECGDGNDYASWSIERDEKTNAPYMVTYPHDGKSYRRPIADRETGALRRVNAVVAARNGRIHCTQSSAWLIPYHQTDPRGCALYLVRRADLASRAGAFTCDLPIEQVYNRGLAVCV